VPAQRAAHGIEPFAIDEEAALHVAKLPDLHRDPFDRLLVAQALVGGLVVLTPDDSIREYPVRTLW
jgi:PIN domain nuclease of toxin-antitoxin system